MLPRPLRPHPQRLRLLVAAAGRTLYSAALLELLRRAARTGHGCRPAGQKGRRSTEHMMSTTANPNTTGEVVSWHAMSVAAVSERLTTTIETGLAASEVSARLQEFGRNRLPEGRKRG